MLQIQGVEPWHGNFTSSSVIAILDSATAHASSGKELTSSSLDDTYFSGLLLCNLFILSSVGCYWFGTDSHYSLNAYLLSVAYFCNERPPLPEIFYSISGLNL